MHLNHTSNFFKIKDKKEAHRDDKTARAIDGSEDGDGTTLKPTNHNLV